MEFKNLNIAKILLVSFISVLLSSACRNIAYANDLNTASLHFTVKNTEQEAVPGAVVKIFTLPDSLFIAGSLSNDTGKGEIQIDETVKNSSMYATCSALSYKDTIIRVLDSNLQFTLTPINQELEEVVVMANKPVITQKMGKFIFYPNDLAKQANSSLQLLSFIPLIDVKDKEISIFNKGVAKIYINGKDTHQSYEMIMQWLRTIPPSRIKNVEIISTPGVSQSSFDDSGIVNINVSDENAGFYGSVNVGGMYFLEKFSPRTILYANYAVQKFRISANFQYENSNSLSRTYNIYDFKNINKKIESEKKYKYKSNSLTGSLTFNYNINSHNLLGLSARILGDEYNTSSTHKRYATIENGETQFSKSSSVSHKPFDKPVGDATLFYNYKNSAGTTVDAEVAFRYNPSLITIERYGFIDAPSYDTHRHTNKNLGVKVKATQSIKTNNTLSGGYEFSLGNLLDSSNTSTENYDFRYVERIHSGWLQYERTWSSIFSSRIGLRYENFQHSGRLVGEGKKDSKNEHFLIPDVGLYFNFPKGNQSLSLSYNRLLLAPSYNALNPYVNWINDDHIRKGNPNLDVSLLDKITISYGFLNKFVISAEYTSFSKMYTNGTVYENNIIVDTYLNGGKEKSFQPTVTYYDTFFNIWNLSATLQATYTDFKFAANNIDYKYKDWHGMFIYSNNILLSGKHKWNLTVDYALFAPSKSLGLNQSQWRNMLNINMSKAFDFGLNINISYNTYLGLKKTEWYNTSDYYLRTRNNYSNDMLNITLNYVFGNRKANRATSRQSSLINREK